MGRENTVIREWDVWSWNYGGITVTGNDSMAYVKWTTQALGRGDQGTEMPRYQKDHLCRHWITEDYDKRSTAANDSEPPAGGFKELGEWSRSVRTARGKWPVFLKRFTSRGLQDLLKEWKCQVIFPFPMTCESEKISFYNIFQASVSLQSWKETQLCYNHCWLNLSAVMLRSNLLLLSATSAVLPRLPHHSEVS